jgi:hypothetical protein
MAELSMIKIGRLIRRFFSLYVDYSKAHGADQQKIDWRQHKTILLQASE